jgi:hypothetical protein
MEAPIRELSPETLTAPETRTYLNGTNGLAEKFIPPDDNRHKFGDITLSVKNRIYGETYPSTAHISPYDALIVVAFYEPTRHLVASMRGDGKVYYDEIPSECIAVEPGIGHHEGTPELTPAQTRKLIGRLLLPETIEINRWRTEPTVEELKELFEWLETGELALQHPDQKS